MKASGKRSPLPQVPSPTSGIETVGIEATILEVRGQRVLLDTVLATLYGVEPRILNQAVKRHLDRFPDDFLFQLTDVEHAALRSQIVILESASATPDSEPSATGRGRHRKYLPYVFTEQGVAMLSSVLHSPRAIRVNIEIMRAFVRLRRFLVTHEKLAQQLDGLERKYDKQFQIVFDAIRHLISPAPPNRRGRRIGFASWNEEVPKNPKTRRR